MALPSIGLFGDELQFLRTFKITKVTFLALSYHPHLRAHRLSVPDHCPSFISQEQWVGPKENPPKSKELGKH